MLIVIYVRDSRCCAVTTLNALCREKLSDSLREAFRQRLLLCIIRTGIHSATVITALFEINGMGTSQW